MKAFGGHLVESKVSATVEVFLEAFKNPLEKKIDKETGLKLFDLPQKIS